MAAKPKAAKDYEDKPHVETAMEILSASGLNTYAECEYKFWLVYGPHKLREPPTKHTIRGSLVHKVCEELRDQQISGNRQTWKTEIMQLASALFEKRWATNKSLHEEGEAFKEQTWMQIRNYALSIIRDMEAMIFSSPDFGLKGIFTMAKPKVELAINLVEEYGLRGTIDEVIDKDANTTALSKHWLLPETEAEEIGLGDLKTSKIFKLAWTPEYERQLKFYALLYYLKYGKMPTYGVIKFLSYGKESYIKFTMRDVEEMKVYVDAVQKKAKEDYANESAWKPNTEATFCKYCWHGRTGACQAGFAKWHSENGTPQ
jgi:hypothetical protein